MTHRSAEEKGDRDRVQEEKPGEKRERQRKSEITHYAKSAGDLPEIDQAGRIGAKPVCLFFFLSLSPFQTVPTSHKLTVAYCLTRCGHARRAST